MTTTDTASQNDSHLLSAAQDEVAELQKGPEARRVRGALTRRRVRSEIFWWAMRLLLFAAFLGLWQLAVNQGWISRFFFSSPMAVGAFLVQYIGSGDFLLPVWTTVEEAILAFLLGSAAGIAAGILLARFQPARKLLSPFLTALNALPRVALAPLFILWFGIGLESKIFLGASLVFFVVLISTESGILAVDPEYLKVVDSLGAKNSDRLRKVIMPSIVPPVFSGLRVGIIYALLGVVTAEMVASKVGLGQAVVYFSSTFKTDGVLGVLFILAMVALVINGLLGLVERRLIAWRD